MIERRHQVFLSSTFLDLKEERSEAIQALLELDCMPAGMELFPAADEEQWTWIKKIIDASDYYIVVLGGRYGSLHSESGLSYTEMEYRYAVQQGKPTIAFLHEEPGKIILEKSDIDREKLEKLTAFRSLCEQKLCKSWNSPADLAAKLSRSLTQLIKAQPRPGWVRGDAVVEGQQIEVLTLRQEVRDLREQLATANVVGGSDDIASGDDIFDARYYWGTVKIVEEGETKKFVQGEYLWGGIPITWNQILAIVAPILTTDGRESNCNKAINEAVAGSAKKEILKIPDGFQLGSLAVGNQSLDQIRIQLIALGYIVIENDTSPANMMTMRSDPSRARFWRLTEKGRLEVARAAALRKGERRARDPKRILKSER